MITLFVIVLVVGATAVISVVGAFILCGVCSPARMDSAKHDGDSRCAAPLNILAKTYGRKNTGALTLFLPCWIACLCGYLVSEVCFGAVFFAVVNSEIHFNASMQVQYATQMLITVFCFALFLPSTLFLLPCRYARTRGEWVALFVLLVVIYSFVSIPFFVPVSQMAFDNGRAIASHLNMSRICTALERYAQDHDGLYPPQAICGPDGKALLSWRVLILPYLEHDELYRAFKLDEPWDSPHNRRLIEWMPREFLLRGGQGDREGSTYYQTIVYTPNDQAERGLRLLVVEARDPVPWTEPVDIIHHSGQSLPSFGGVTGTRFEGIVTYARRYSKFQSLNSMQIECNVNRSELDSMRGGLPSACPPANHGLTPASG